MYKIKKSANTDTMNKENRIRAFFIAGTGVLIAGYTLWTAQPETSEKEKQSNTEKEIVKEETSEVSKEQEAYEYVILNNGGFLCVYLKDLKTVYFQTDIPYDKLNEEMQQKIDQGYLIRNAEELYDFLENYSS